MDNEQLVQLVTNEVMRQLKESSLGQILPYHTKQHKALAIFTGGTIGFEQSLPQLKKIQEHNVELTIVLSMAAEKVIGCERIKEELGSHITIITAQSAYPGKLLREVDLVLVPVLTQNTAAKLAQTLSDTVVSTLIFQALMLGIPVIAAGNAADPLDSWRIKKDMGKASPGLVQALRGNLQKIEQYGIQLVDVECLAAASQKLTDCRSKTAVAEVQSKKGILDAASIKVAAGEGAKSISVSRGTIITPLARDVAQEYGVEIVRES